MNATNNTTLVNQGQVNTENPYVELPAQAYLARVSNRPAIAALNGLFSSFPVIKIFTSNAVPMLVARENSRRKNEQAN